ncbi:MAG TPA: 16S rRNA (guanine(527)-N(7))-methyltransferase RsmG [Terriglobales bacterium]|nr:16S rRNA (guanine(527)-N(7))-methyltransferase RsmG [Terriglobales bacterium]
MDTKRIADLLAPFLCGTSISTDQLNEVSLYLERLLRWNQRMNLTAIRDPDQIITRHFGESFFAGMQIMASEQSITRNAIDVGSGAGFPGLPIKILAPWLPMRLLEAQHRKAIFLREVVRDLDLQKCEVLAERAEVLVQSKAAVADLVTIRAVERFENVLPIAAQLTSSKGRLLLLIGREQVSITLEALPGFRWLPPIPIPLSASRLILIGSNKEPG